MSEREQDWWYEIMPLTFGRARIVHTNGYVTNGGW